MEGVGHILIGCTEFGKGQKTLLEELGGMENSWIVSFIFVLHCAAVVLT